MLCLLKILSVECQGKKSQRISVLQEIGPRPRACWVNALLLSYMPSWLLPFKYTVTGHHGV